MVSYTYRKRCGVRLHTKCWTDYVFCIIRETKTSGSMQAVLTRKQLSQSELPTCLIARVWIQIVKFRHHIASFIYCLLSSVGRAVDSNLWVTGSRGGIQSTGSLIYQLFVCHFVFVPNLYPNNYKSFLTLLNSSFIFL